MAIDAFESRRACRHPGASSYDFTRNIASIARWGAKKELI